MNEFDEAIERLDRKGEDLRAATEKEKHKPAAKLQADSEIIFAQLAEPEALILLDGIDEALLTETIYKRELLEIRGFVSRVLVGIRAIGELPRNRPGTRNARLKLIELAREVRQKVQELKELDPQLDLTASAKNADFGKSVGLQKRPE